MRRYAPILLFIAIACGGGGSDGGSTGPKAVATVSVATPSTTITVGQQVTLSFSAFDASGGSLTGRSSA